MDYHLLEKEKFPSPTNSTTDVGMKIVEGNTMNGLPIDESRIGLATQLSESDFSFKCDQ